MGYLPYKKPGIRTRIYDHFFRGRVSYKPSLINRLLFFIAKKPVGAPLPFTKVDYKVQTFPIKYCQPLPWDEIAEDLKK